MNELPMASYAVEPTRLFAAETRPVTPEVPLPQVTAPASTMEPESQRVEVTT